MSDETRADDVSEDTATETAENPEGDDTETDEQTTDSEQQDTFPRSYVEELSQENGRYRQRAQQADQLAQRFHIELVRATNRLADPTDLPFNTDHLDDPAALTVAIDDLLAWKPHLANRRPVGDIGQGPMSVASANFDMAAILRQRAH
ncbi:hypothetical protein PR370_15825 [Mycobacterium marinum]|nr:hypothetical protein [Mycobacterium marinum]MDC8982551.1 hypothetical protein [Mycobacterium marinum]MDC8999065.1 hypothetical protein [Mycobacterium marinum]MDC9011513.1 hypothetical protein [Mycobacterium marinum]